MKKDSKKMTVLKPDLNKISERSYGTVLYTVKHDHIYFVIAEALNGDFGFPKGHLEKGETEKQAALRETEEEVGIKAMLVNDRTYVDEYVIKGGFVAKIGGTEKRE